VEDKVAKRKSVHVASCVQLFRLRDSQPDAPGFRCSRTIRPTKVIATKGIELMVQLPHKRVSVCIEVVCLSRVRINIRDVVEEGLVCKTFRLTGLAVNRRKVGAAYQSAFEAAILTQERRIKCQNSP